jgi:hypothetical protein
MKKAQKQGLFAKFVFSALPAVFAVSLLSSCSQTPCVAPVQPAKNMVTIRVQSNSQQLSTQHLRITNSLQPSGVVLEKDITGNFTYTFDAKAPAVTVTATLTSDVPFSSSLAIDANNRLEAYHNSACSGNEIDITKEIDFSR